MKTQASVQEIFDTATQVIERCPGESLGFNSNEYILDKTWCLTINGAQEPIVAELRSSEVLL